MSFGGFLYLSFREFCRRQSLFIFHTSHCVCLCVVEEERIIVGGFRLKRATLKLHIMLAPVWEDSNNLSTINKIVVLQVNKILN
jgi:hypothetical protein